MHQFNKVDLGFFPTPLHQLEGLSKALKGPSIYIKRDDQTGLALGGNKTRKLEYILADALAQGCDTIITAGAAQSNHCRQTAAAGAKLQLECHLLLGGSKPEQINGNLLLDQLFGCHIHWCGDKRKGEDIPLLVETLKAQGKKPYVVPYGGSNELGAIAFAQAIKELSQQDPPEFSSLFFASSSGATHAGLLLGQYQQKLKTQIHGINIDKEAMAGRTLAEYILDLTNQTAEFAGIEHQFNSADIILNDNYIADGYGVIGNPEKEAIGLLAQTEGILLDPVYTGRAMAGLIDMVRQGCFSPDENILFWHTGGAPALFAYNEFL